jgi:hypothetical protein
MTTHQPITHTIAIGSHAGVNTILGKTFIKWGWGKLWNSWGIQNI